MAFSLRRVGDRLPHFFSILHPRKRVLPSFRLERVILVCVFIPVPLCKLIALRKAALPSQGPSGSTYRRTPLQE
jgi:hypothetical protein